jgi:ribosomal protein S18 acetylase RimI-like enzyme
MPLTIRPFVETDGPRLVEILKANNQFDWPDVEGLRAMQRVAACDAAIFLVAEIDGYPQGLVRAVYDGSRAMIHLLSVSQEAQRRGIGSALVTAVRSHLRDRGAPSVSVTVTDASAGFWRAQGFERLPVFVMLKSQI